MNLHKHNQEDTRKYIAKSIKPAVSDETDGLTKEEFAQDFIKAYDGALKMLIGKKPRNRDIREKIVEWKKIAEEAENESIVKTTDSVLFTDKKVFNGIEDLETVHIENFTVYTRDELYER